MKKIMIFGILSAALLCGCGSGENPAETAPVPETPEITAEPPAADDRNWWEEIDVSQLPDVPDAKVTVSGADCWLLDSIEQQDISVYCGTDAEQSVWLIRKGDELSGFPSGTRFAEPPSVPTMRWDDFDLDGEPELLTVYSLKPQSGELHVYEWDSDWQDHCFDADVFDPLLLEQIDYSCDKNGVTAICNGQSASYTPGPDDRGTVKLLDTFADLNFYRVQENYITVIFGVGVESDGQPRYFANLTASLLYDGESFSISGCTLQPVGGV